MVEGPATQWRALRKRREEQVFLVLTLVIGALVGLTVVAFILMTEHVGARVYPVGGAAVAQVSGAGDRVADDGLFLYRFFPDARGSGVPQTKAALCARGGKIISRPFREVLLHVGDIGERNSAGARRAGGAGGRGLASLLGRALGLSPEKVKALIPVGAAAAIAAAFNTPLAAVVFALEEVVGDLHAPVLGSVVLASATSWGDVATDAGERSAVQGAEVSAGASGGVGDLCGAGGAGRVGFGGVCRVC